MGIEVRAADYTQPATLAHAFAGVDRLLLISSSENGKRKEQHRNVIDAAKDAGIGLIVYTSILHADTSPLFLAEEHRDTEAALVDVGVPFVLLRNGWYSEVYTWRLPLAFKHGVLMGAGEMDGSLLRRAPIMPGPRRPCWPAMVTLAARTNWQGMRLLCWPSWSPW